MRGSKRTKLHETLISIYVEISRISNRRTTKQYVTNGITKGKWDFGILD